MTLTHCPLCGTPFDMHGPNTYWIEHDPDPGEDCWSGDNDDLDDKETQIYQVCGDDCLKAWEAGAQFL